MHLAPDFSIVLVVLYLLALYYVKLHRFLFFTNVDVHFSGQDIPAVTYTEKEIKTW